MARCGFPPASMSRAFATKRRAAGRALAGRVPEAEPADRHAHRLRPALARVCGDESGRARIPAQADLAQGVARPPALNPDQAAPDGSHWRPLRAAAAPAGASADLLHTACPRLWVRPAPTRARPGTGPIRPRLPSPQAVRRSARRPRPRTPARPPTPARDRRTA